MLVQYNNEALV